MAKKTPPKPVARPSRAKSAAPVRMKRPSPTLLRQALNASAAFCAWRPPGGRVPSDARTPAQIAHRRPVRVWRQSGGIDERWFSSTTPAANEGAAWDEGLSYVVHDGKKAFTLREAICLWRRKAHRPRHLG